MKLALLVNLFCFIMTSSGLHCGSIVTYEPVAPDVSLPMIESNEVCGSNRTRVQVHIHPIPALPQPKLDFNQHPPNGASQRTAGSDRLAMGGVEASRSMAARDLDAVNRYKRTIVEVSRQMFVPPELIAAIASRESRGGKALRKEWEFNGDHYGMMQINKRWHKVIEDEQGHFRQAASILGKYRGEVAAKHPGWGDTQHWQGAVAAYNFGVRNVWTWSQVDRGTTGNDYSHDVMARAMFFRENGYDVTIT